jgi:hypothetical protein
MTDDEINGIIAWVIERGLVGASEIELLHEFCERSVAAGLALSSAMAVIDTLHPIWEGRAFLWSSDGTEQNPAGRIRHTHWLLLSAALIMSVFLIASSLVTTLLISAADFRPASDQVPAGPANGRALAFLAHRYLGDGFGTAYDLSTILILWFAGASAMAGLVNIVPRYLPRYGMAPEWAAASRPLVLIYIAIAFAVTIIFEANVDAQGGAYATGVLVLMTSAAIAVTLSAWRKRSESSWPVAAFALIAAIFLYTTIANIVERPDGVKIAAFFIGSIVITSMLSRVWRTTELRVEIIEIDCAGQHFLDEALAATDQFRHIEKVLHGDVVEADMVKPPAHICRLRHDRDIVRKVGDAQKARRRRSVLVADDALTFSEAENIDHEITNRAGVCCQQVEMVNAANWNPLPRALLRTIAHGRLVPS